MSKPYLHRWVNAAGVKTHYLTSGEGEPIILLHGGGAGVSAVHNWQHSMGPMAEAGFSVYAPEVVGFGLTDKPTNGNGIQAKIDHVKNMIDALCLDKVNLVGNSMGGRISLGIALEWPDRVNKMVLMGSGGMPLTKPSPELAELFSYKPSMENMRKMVEGFCYDGSVITDDMLEMRLKMSNLPGAQEAYEAFMKGVADPNERQQMDVSTELHKINTEALLIWGKQDRVIPLSMGEEMVKLLPNARLEVIDKCGHWVQIEHAAKFAGMVTKFFAD